MSLLGFGRKTGATGPSDDPGLARFLRGYSIEVLPKTAAKVPDFREILPKETRVYIAHVDGTDIADMAATAARLTADGFQAMPHIPARSVPSRSDLEDWLARYRDAGVDQALLIAGGSPEPRGDLDSSLQLIETGLFDNAGFKRLHVAGHPEGNKDIDRDGGEAGVMAAIGWKAAYARRTDADMAIVTQFCFEAAPVIAWEKRLTEAGIDLPIHIGVPGPAKLQTLIKFALISGVGPSVRVIQNRAKDLTKLVLPFEPTGFLADLAAHKEAHPDFGIEKVHFFPFGGIARTATYANDLTGQKVQAVA